VIDLPVAREAATDYPVLVGSSLKGALKDLVPAKNEDGTVNEMCVRLFGKQDDAGQLLVSDARILLLPVRSLTGQYRWVTCPHILERFARDKRRAGQKTNMVQVKVSAYDALGHGKEDLFLEERQFKVTGVVHPDVLSEVAAMIGNDDTRGRLEKQLVVLSDEDFAWFARYGLSVQARNVLDTEKKTSKNLWYEETLPPDTVMYALIAERHEGKALKDFRPLFADRPYLQAGGNETIGQGVFLVRCEPEA
jgi:CRISPR-associated protein Cmr4